MRSPLLALNPVVSVSNTISRTVFPSHGHIEPHLSAQPVDQRLYSSARVIKTE